MGRRGNPYDNAKAESVMKPGVPRPDNWEIAFVAITPHNLKDDTPRVSDDVCALYRQVAGQDVRLGI